jgi:hypothetical protein
MNAPSRSWRFGIIIRLVQLRRHCERSEAIQRRTQNWIASSQVLLAMTIVLRSGVSTQHIPMHPAAVEMKKRYRRVMPQRPGGEAFFQFVQDMFSPGVQVGQRF